MSRRKQSNPKPLKREDEEWGNEGEAMPGEPRTPSSGGERPASSGGASPASGGSASSPAASPPRLRLNTSLATDPALAPQATPLKREPPSPSPPPPPTAPQTARDYLALTAAAAAFPALFPTAPTGYMCKPCGIRYSSLSTLQAHQEHYCSNRRPKTADGGEAPADPTGDESSSDAKTPRPPPGKQYACSYCSYSADKKVSLNRHMRMHSSSPVSSGTPAPTPTSNGDATDPPVAQDRYCADCDIRFSSIKTYRAHKTHYCSTRQVVKQALAAARGGSATSGSAPPSPGATPPAQNQYALALPTNPILILPYSLLRSASTLPGATLPDPDTPCFLLPNGTFQPINRVLPNVTADGKEPEVLKSANRPREPSRDGATPLDLSVRRSPESVTTDEHEKENRIRSTTPEQIVCAPSLPGSPGTPSPSRRSSSPSAESSPKRRRRNSRGPTPKPPSIPSPPEDKFSPVVPPALLPPALALRLASELPVAAAAPQVLVKQGVSKCKECNIVFCKYENYRIHKRHYCSAGGGEERASPAPPEPGPPPQYRQLICMACGIHFSSLDNLTTHQSYYCTKRETRSPRSVPEIPRPTSGSEGGWKCPCCDVVSPTAAAAQRHMEAHAGVKAFRCTICKYRGNTLRGMRTHIRMHFPKKPADLQEESFIACVLEDDTRETTSPSPAVGSDRVHRCTSCGYTSTYRGNVVRHARLVHATEDPEPEEQTSPPAPTVDIKKEPETELEETPNYCKSCDISFKYVNTYKAHKQFYCTANNQDAAANNNVPTAANDTPVV
ncbi:zinc finger protein ush isoform X2 [Pectinophora gossypiella]|uniref:zinc finger protein ush isoform X2 n=1 Tax=Pectinophora gossypiella TaxID=13191 RepID=UPI00214ED5CD|nr:zinc finger protein ush isoform X2 [Pectinophora gossypiella]